MQTEVPGNYTSPTQPYPTRPEPLDRIVLNGITDEFVLDYTPELKRRAHGDPEQVPDRRALRAAAAVSAQEHVHQQRRLRGRAEHLSSAGRRSHDRRSCIAPHARSCVAPSYLVPTEGQGRGADRVRRARARKRGAAATGSRRRRARPWPRGSRAGRAPAVLPLIDGLPVYKPLFQGLAAYDMNTGEKLWDIPVGQTPARIKNHPLLKGVDLSATGRHRQLDSDGDGRPPGADLGGPSRARPR